MTDSARSESETTGGGSSGGAVSRRGIPLFRVAGIRVRADVSWLLIFVLVWWSLSFGYFPRVHPDASAWAYGVTGFVGSLLFFVSLLAHELAHSFMALREGIRVPSITLFLFGGVSEMHEEPSTPSADFRIAIVGPLTSFALAAVFYGVYVAVGDAAPPLVSSTIGYLAFINAALGVFNMLPGLPLDGGRVLRAVVWWRTNSMERATKVASRVGQGLALGIIALGALQIFGGALMGGLWLILIGLFLRAVAGAGYRNLVVRRALEDMRADDVMVRDVVTVGPDLSLSELVDRYILGHGFRGFPVVEGGRVLGVISVAEVKDVDPEKRSAARTGEHLQALSPELCIRPEMPLDEVLDRLQSTGAGRLLVMEGDRLSGMVTASGLSRFVELWSVLGRP